MKRFNVTGVAKDKEYDLTQGKPGSKVVYFTANPNGEAEVIRILLKPAMHLKKLEVYKYFLMEKNLVKQIFMEDIFCLLKRNIKN